MVTLTHELIGQLATPRGGFTFALAERLGAKHRPNGSITPWRRQAVGTVITDEEWLELVELSKTTRRERHHARQPSLFA